MFVMFRSAPVVSLALASAVLAQTYSATYTPQDAPKISEQGQSGTNQCGTGSDPNSMCQNVYVNSLDDFCLFAPPSPGPDSTIGNTERIEVSWCLQSGYGTRLIPDGAITGAHFVQTPDYVQVTGVGDLTKINIPQGNDGGGELDPHGADGNGNPIGGLVFSSAFGGMAQMHEWTNFMANNEFCIRACKDGPKAPALCQHIYDVMGCAWNMPGDYSAGSFDSCKSDSGEPMGVYGTSTFYQGQPATPDAHPAPAKSQCNAANTVANGQTVTLTTPTASTTSSGSSSVSTSSSSSVTASSTTSSGQSSTVTPSSATSTTSTGSSATATGQSMSTTRTSAPPAPTGSGSSSSSSSGTASATGGAGNGAASLFGRGLEVSVAAVAVIVGAVIVA